MIDEETTQLFGAGACLIPAIESLAAASLRNGQSNVQSLLIKNASGRLDRGNIHSLLLSPDALSNGNSNEGMTSSRNYTGVEMTLQPAVVATATSSGDAATNLIDHHPDNGYNSSENDVVLPLPLACALTRISNLERTDFIAVAARERHALLLSSSGDVYEWSLGSAITTSSSNNNNGQSPGSPPINDTQQRAGLSLCAAILWERALRGVRVLALACGSRHCAILAAAPHCEIYTWGIGTDGRLGHGSEMDESSPRVVEALLSLRVTSIAAGGAHTVAVTMGPREWGALEVAENEAAAAVPNGVGEVLDATVATASAMLRRHRRTKDGALALGVVWTWGKGAGGRLGHGDVSSSFVPRRVKGIVRLLHRALTHRIGTGTGTSDTRVERERGVGGEETVAAAVNTVTGTPQSSLLPRWIPGLGFRGTAASNSSSNGGGGPIIVPTSRDYDALRIGLPIPTPRRGESSSSISAAIDVRWRSGVLSERPIVIAIDCGRAFTLALTTDGDVWAWGFGSSGACGIDTTLIARRYAALKCEAIAPPSSALSPTGDLLRPHRIMFPSAHYAPSRIGAVAAARASLARITDHNVRLLVCPWGLAIDDPNKVAGEGTTSTTTTTNAVIRVRSETASSVGSDTGDGTASFFDDGAGVSGLGIDAAVWAGGSHDAGDDAVRIASIATGHAHAVVSARDGTAWAWGANGRGQVGAGRMNDALRVPIQLPLHLRMQVCADEAAATDTEKIQSAVVLPPTWIPFATEANGDISFDPIVSVHAGGDMSAAQTSRGALIVWGDNNEGACGVASTESVVAPQPARVAPGFLSAGCATPYVTSFGSVPMVSPRNTFAMRRDTMGRDEERKSEWGIVDSTLGDPVSSSTGSTVSLNSAVDVLVTGSGSVLTQVPKPLSVAIGAGFLLVLTGHGVGKGALPLSNNSSRHIRKLDIISSSVSSSTLETGTTTTIPRGVRRNSAGVKSVELISTVTAAAIVKRVTAATSLRIADESARVRSTAEWSTVLDTMAGSWDLFQATDSRLGALWRAGVPPVIRARVWPLAVGNALRVTPSLFDLLRSRARSVRCALSDSMRGGGGGGSNSTSPSSSARGIGLPPGITHGREASLALIPMDLLRTFPHLRLFGPPGSHSAGPLHAVVRDVLETVALLRPDVGYVQGMSYVAALISMIVVGANVSASVSRSRVAAVPGWGSPRGVASPGPVTSISSLPTYNTTTNEEMNGENAVQSSPNTASRGGGAIRFSATIGRVPTTSSLSLLQTVSPPAIPTLAMRPPTLDRAAAALSPSGGVRSSNSFFLNNSTSSRARFDSDEDEDDMIVGPQGSPMSFGRFSDAASTSTSATSPRGGGGGAISPSSVQSPLPSSTPDAIPSPQKPTPISSSRLTTTTLGSPSAFTSPHASLSVAESRFLTFQVVANLFSRHHFMVFFACDPGPLAPYYDLFDRALSILQPRLAAYLSSVGIQCEMYLFGWLQTVFLKCLPLSSAARAWDAFLLDGTPALFRAALALMRAFEPHILRGDFNSFEEAIQLLTHTVGSNSSHFSGTRVWNSIGRDATIFARAIDAIILPPDVLIDLEDVAGDPFFYRRVIF